MTLRIFSKCLKHSVAKLEQLNKNRINVISDAATACCSQISWLWLTDCCRTPLWMISLAPYLGLSSCRPTHGCDMRLFLVSNLTQSFYGGASSFCADMQPKVITALVWQLARWVGQPKQTQLLSHSTSLMDCVLYTEYGRWYSTLCVDWACFFIAAN